MKKFLLTVMLLLPVWAWSGDAVFPGLTGPVVDTTSTLRPEQVKVLSDKSRALQRQKGAQVVICMVDTTSPLPIEDYGIRLAGKWKVGRAKIDDGVIIIVALKDRKMRIEVGYGLEPVITDLKAGRIIDLVMAPEFRRGDFFAGLNNAMDAVAELVKGGEPAAFRAYDAAIVPGSSSGPDLNYKIAVGLFIAAFFIFIILMLRTNIPVSLLVTYALHYIALFLLQAGTYGEIALFTLFIMIFYTIVGVAVKYGDSSGGSSSSSSSSYSSSSSSSYSGSSSSYSGGGGSFGGGGASGGW